MGTSIRPGVEGANALRRMYLTKFRTAPNDMAVVSKAIPEAEEVEKVGEALRIRIIPTVVTAEVGDSDDPGALTFQAPTISHQTGTPLYTVCALSVADNLTTKMTSGDKASFFKGLGQQQLKAMATKRDTEATEFIATSASIQKGGPSHVNRAELLDALATIGERGKEMADLYGDKQVNFFFHAREIPHLGQINEITLAYARGDKQNPMVKGVVVDALGLKLRMATTIFVSNGVAYNPMFTDDGYRIGWNQKAQELPDQYFHLERRMIVRQEFAYVEVFDEPTLVFRTPTTN